MELFKDLIDTVGLDQSFFYQFILVATFYFICKKIFLQAYCNDAEKRREMTKGKLIANKKLQDQIEQTQREYEKKVQTLNKKFQEVFGEIKKQAENTFKEDKQQFQTAYERNLEDKQKTQMQEIQKQEKQMQEDLPHLAEILVNKMKESK